MPDVIVIGGGVMGLATARELRRRGRSVTLLDRARPGHAASWASAGIVPSPSGNPTDPGFQLQALSYRLWPSLAHELVEETGLDPEFRENGCLIPALGEGEAADLRRAVRLGAVPDGKFLTGAELREAEPVLGPDVVAAVWKPGGNVENRRLCRALEMSCLQRGVEVRAGSEARAIVSEGDRVVGVDLLGERLTADVVVVAAGAWSGALPGCRPIVPVVPQRGQILALDRAGVTLRQVILTPDDPYLVPRADGRIVVGATRELAGWDPAYTASGVAGLLTQAIRLTPALQNCPIHEIWTGFRPLCLDGFPIVGPGAARGLFYVTGHGPSGIGPLPGTIALLLALTEGESPPIPDAPFSPMRFV